MSEISIQSTVIRNDDIVVGTVDRDIMMMSIETGMYYQINPSGGRIWALLERPRTVADLCALLAEDFKVTAESCAGDVLHFVRELAARNIVRVE